MELAAPSAGRRSGHLERRILLASVCAGIALAAAGTAAAITAGSGAPWEAVGARALIVAVPMAVGLRAILRRENARFGRVLVAVGAALLVATLAESDDELAYTIGRAAGWLVELMLIYLLLSFPTGRLPERTDRALVGLAALVVLIAFVPRLALAQHFDVPSPYTSCASDCPSNAFFLLDHQPAFVNGLIRPAGGLLMVAISAAVVLRLRERLRDGTAIARRMFLPVLAVGIARMGLLALGFVARQANPELWPVQVLAWSLALSAPVIALAFLTALVRWQLDAGKGLERLGERLGELPDIVALRQALADVFGDPRLDIALGPDAVPKSGGGLQVSEIRDGDTVVASVVHDEALAANPRFLDAGLAVAGVVLAKQRLTAEADTATRDLQRSRARIATSAERERRRIERDLHDGAQQRLVALRIELELTEDLVRSDPGLAIGRLRELEHDLDEALDELRSLAHGVYPPLLADRGLAEALETVASRSPVAVEVTSRGIGRYPPEIESAVYFCIVEALQNVLKHAQGAHRVHVDLDASHRHELRFSVRDDGGGAPDGHIAPGAGITNMRDRIAAVGGGVWITSLQSVGTAVRGRVPLA